jgi:hypothetical protein
MVLELVWLLIAALTYPLTASAAYATTWAPLLGPLWSAFDWLLRRLDALAPGLYTGAQPHAAAFALFLGALIVGCAVYLFAIRTMDGAPALHPAALGLVVVFALIFQVTLFFMPGILSTDLATYAVNGRISAVYGANPYVVPPSAFPNDLFLPWWIARGWYTTTSPYGPLWTDISWLIARFTGDLDQIPQMLSYRLLVNIVQVANLALFWWLIGRLAVTARLATFVAFAWSPLLLFQVDANGHNDAVMLLFILLAFAVLASRPGNRAWVVALMLLVLGALVKWAAAAPALYCAVAWARGLPTWRQRVYWLGAAGAILAAVTLLIASPWIPGLLAPRTTEADVGIVYANWLVDVPAAWFAGHVLDRAGHALDEARHTARLVFQVPALLVVVALVLLEVRRVWRVAERQVPLETLHAVLAASTRALLAAIVLASPQVQAWYFSWPLTLGLLLGWRTMTARVALAYSLLFPPVAYLRDQTGSNPVDPLLVAYAVLPLALPAAAWLRLRVARNSDTSGGALKMAKIGSTGSR